MSKSGTKSEMSTTTAQSAGSYEKKAMGPKPTDSSKKQQPKSLRVSMAKDSYKKQGPKSIRGAPIEKGKEPIYLCDPMALKDPLNWEISMTSTKTEVSVGRQGEYETLFPKKSTRQEATPVVKSIKRDEAVKSWVEIGPTDSRRAELAAESKRKKIVWGVAVLLVVLVIVAVVLITLWLTGVFGKETAKAATTPTSASTTGLNSSTDLSVYEGDGATFFDGVCIEKYPNVNRSCLAGSPPGLGSCSGSGTCTHFVYRVNYDTQSRKSEFLSNTTIDQWTAVANGTRQLCKDDRNRLGVCSENGQCDRSNSGLEDKSWYMDAQWEDSCDVPNPCWDGETSVLVGDPEGREKCRSKVGQCYPDQDAIVWMQHLRCKIGKNRTTSGGCTGLPMRLWRCKECPPSSPPRCTGGDFVSSNVTQCSYTCKTWTGGEMVVFALPDGHQCNYSANPEATAYCFGGQCFPVHANVSDTKLMTVDECNKTWAQYDQ